MSAAPLREEFSSLFRDLKALTSDFDRWADSLDGADLWVDGFDALRSTDEELFGAYLDLFLRVVSASGRSSDSKHWEATELLSLYDAFLEACAADSCEAFWHALCVGICLVRILQADWLLQPVSHAIVNDTLLKILSPNYRAIRIAAYNSGVEIMVSDRYATFRPEYYRFAVYPPFLITERIPRIQQYNVNHDLVHVVLFGDAYLRPIGTKAETAALLLNAEESACSVDLLMIADVMRFGYHLHVLEEYKRIERKWTPGMSQTVSGRAASSADTLVRYQRGLKASAQQFLSHPSSISAELRQRSEIPGDLYGWLSEDAQRWHANWNERLSARIHHPLFQRIVSLIPPNARHHENLLRLTAHEWTCGEIITGRIERPDDRMRQANLARNALRFRLIRSAELAVHAFDSTLDSRDRLVSEITDLCCRTAVALAGREDGWHQVAKFDISMRRLLEDHSLGIAPVMAYVASPLARLDLSMGS